jgi:hypothetical protein
MIYAVVGLRPNVSNNYPAPGQQPRLRANRDNESEIPNCQFLFYKTEPMNIYILPENYIIPP